MSRLTIKRVKIRRLTKIFVLAFVLGSAAQMFKPLHMGWLCQILSWVALIGITVSVISEVVIITRNKKE